MSNETNETIQTALDWLRSALDCAEFIWEDDQAKDAEAAYAEAVAALSAAPAASALRAGDARQFDGKWMVCTDPDMERFVSFDGQDAPTPVAGDAVSRLPDELMDASGVEDGDGNIGASIAYADAAGRLRTALAQDRASQGAAAGVPEGWRLVPVEPTRKMLNAPQHVWPPEALKCWNEMLAAAPSAPTQGAVE